MAKCSQEFDTHKRDPRHVQENLCKGTLALKTYKRRDKIEANWLGMTTVKKKRTSGRKCGDALDQGLTPEHRIPLD